GMFPGANKIGDDQLDQGEKQLKVTEAIIQSMTKLEKENPKTIDPKRKRRIAAGSGTEVQDVNRLLKQYEQMQQMMKQMGKINKKGKKGGFGGMMPPGLM
ncbi:MAG: signal recognition particle protein, partial [Clostridia bacterium]